MRAVVFALILCKAPVKGLPLLDPTPVPTPCVETINELDAVKTINEDDCKVWKITSLIRSLTVTSSSASAEVEDVDVTFSDARGVSGFLAVGEGGNAKATTIAAEGDIDGGVRVAARNGELGGTATSTSIIVQGAIGSAQVPRYGYLVSVLVGFGLNSNAYDTNIAAGSVGGTIEVGEDGGKATNTNIAVEGSVGEVFVGDEGGKATNTNIAVEGSVDEPNAALMATYLEPVGVINVIQVVEGVAKGDEDGVVIYNISQSPAQKNASMYGPPDVTEYVGCGLDFDPVAQVPCHHYFFGMCTDKLLDPKNWYNEDDLPFFLQDWD